jgi:hypothetical protein
MPSSGMLSRVALVKACIGLLGTANVVPNSPILVILMMEAIRTSETLVLKKTT